MPRVRPAPHRVLWPLGLGTALSLIGDATLYTVLPTHTAEAGIPLTRVGLLLGVNRAIRVLLNGPMGAGYDRLPRRCLLVPAFFVGALSTLLGGVTRGFWPLLAARLLWGLAWSAIWVGGNTVILDISGDADRGRWSGFYQVWFFTGVAAGAFLGGALTDQIGYHAALRGGAALTTLGALAVLLFLPETRPLSMASDGPERPPSGSGGGRRRSLLGIGRFSPPLQAAIFLQGGNRFAFAGVVVATLGLLLQQRLGDQPTLLGQRVGVATVTGGLLALRLPFNLVSAPLTGLLSD
ncbi:MAG: MFS transporter, partial [Chloroflexi bacterium]